MNNKSISKAINAVTSFLSRGWETINSPTKARCEAYSSQASYAQEQMRKENVSRRERKYWSKQSDKAMNGLADVHNTNSDTFIKLVCAVGAGWFIGHKLFSNK